LLLMSSALLAAWSCTSTQRFGVGSGSDGGDAALGGESSGGSDGATGEKPAGGEPTNPIGGGGVGGAQTETLTVVSTTPGDGASAVERDVPIEVVFSARLDAQSVTAETFVVEGPTGPVSGKLATKGATATFTPSGAWSLLADYKVTLASTIRDEAGTELSAEHRFGFQSRDGVFRQPERLASGTIVNLQFVGSHEGHAAVVWEDDMTPPSTLAVVFDPNLGTWGEVAGLESDNQNGYVFSSLSFNESGHAFAVLGNQVWAWNRFNGIAWGSASKVGVAERRYCALAADGAAMTFWENVVGNDFVVYAQSLSKDNEWSAVETLRTGARMFGLIRFGEGFLAFHKLDADQAVYSNTYDAQQGTWGQAKQVMDPVGFSGVNQGIVTRDRTALFIWWDEMNVATAGLFDGTSWTNEELGPLSGGTHASVGAKGYLAAWENQGNAYASFYDLKLGWGDPIKLGAITAEYSGPGAEIDDSGNALAAWPDGSSITWRRAPHGSTWSEPQQLKDQDPAEVVYSNADSSGNVILVWLNSLGVWATRFE
jgi:hypothetical protein